MLLNISTIIIKKKYIEKWQGFHVYDFSELSQKL